MEDKDFRLERMSNFPDGQINCCHPIFPDILRTFSPTGGVCNMFMRIQHVAGIQKNLDRSSRWTVVSSGIQQADYITKPAEKKV